MRKEDDLDFAGIDKGAWHWFDVVGYGVGFETSHVNRCIQDANKAFGTLDEARNSGDAQMARDAVHSLRGIAGNLGLEAVNARLSQLSEDIKERGPILADATVKALRQQIHEGVEVIVAWRHLPPEFVQVEKLLRP